MKKQIFLILALCVFLCGCRQTGVEVNHISKIETQNIDGYSVDLMQLDKDYVYSISCIWKDNIIYSDSSQSVQTYYRYDITEDTTYKIGSIEYPFVSSEDIVAIDDKIYFYYGTIAADMEKMERTTENALYQIDLTENTLQKIASVDVDQTLIYLSAANGEIVSYKGIFDGDKGITYLDMLDVSDQSNIKFDTLLQKEYDMKEMYGETLSCFSIHDSNIYIIVRSNNTAGDISWNMEKYDLDGNYMESWPINHKIIEWLNEEPISKFEVFGEYGFLSNFSGGGVVFRISSDEIAPEFLRELELDIDVPADNASGDYAVLFSRATGEIWRMDIAEGSLYKLDLPYQSLNCIYMGNDNKVLISSDTDVYGDLSQFPTEGGNLLEH